MGQGSIQEVLEQCVSKIVCHRVKIIGAGRTDSGVHALGQVCNFTTRSSVPLEGLRKGLNSILPKDIKCLIVGDGPDRIKLENLARQLKIEDRVFFLGQIEHNKVFQYLKISDVFVRPSLSEGLGNSFLEAMAVGIPIIGTPVGGIPDFLKDEKTGLFCEVRNHFSIAEKIVKILKDEKLKNRLVENAKELVFKNYNWDNIAKEMDEVFKMLKVGS